MISIITAVRNQLDMNMLFHESLVKYSRLPFELIIVDNASIDGSGDFFLSKDVNVIRNDVNYSYPVSQNIGILHAKYDYLAFLNNDIIVADGWDERFVKIMQNFKGLEILTCSGIENAGNIRETKRYRRKWNLVKNAMSWMGNSYQNLNAMHKIMYGDWIEFSDKRWGKHQTNLVEGFVGNSIFMHRRALDKVGLWDERIQAADFDLFIRSKKRSIEKQDILPCQIALGVFNHHYIRLTYKSKVNNSFYDADNIIKLEEKYSQDEINYYLKDIHF
jgi:GT2 family glycosyltransferase